MDFWSQIFVPYILPAIGTALGGLVSWLIAMGIKWITSKIKNKEVAALLATIMTIAGNAVKSTYQSYVEGIKGTDGWTKDAQAKALNMALETAKSELTTGAIDYIQKEHGDVDKYLKTLFESILYDLKNSNKKTETTESK
jgi:hypothetical protein